MSQQKLSYYQKISLATKTPEEAERITELFYKNINMANKLASKYYKTKYWDFDEALQIARMGLWKACLIWDPSKYRLSTLAYNIMNRDFIDYDREQKRQPDILFNLEDNCVTEDLSLNDVLVDVNADIENDYIEQNEVTELTQDIIYILEDIAEELDLPKSEVKLIYLTLIESNQDKTITLKDINFIKRSTVKEVIAQIQTRIQNLMKNE